MSREQMWAIIVVMIAVLLATSVGSYFDHQFKIKQMELNCKHGS